MQVSRASLDRWIRDYRRGGFTALVPAPRRVAAQTPASVLELAVALKTERPDRTAAQVAVVLGRARRVHPSARTLQRHFAAAGFTRTRPDGTAPAVFGRFEAERRMTGGSVTRCTARSSHGRKAILIAFLDDHCRAVAGYRWARPRTPSRWRPPAHRAGRPWRPGSVYVDNGQR